ncbi:alpha/beta-hydrolase [Cucurbitaria berberidis CBS 394.84]|uniref:Alpha/beta-hydrolase n=1 Tax=Cucurbitaria berberidis CBS 394.84 TaxID=1168544 RepID=A0A9P4L6Y8_9PLEO|nr:alpha/beta-hydrolase [Cucurbitaria berberidis CBS 394.84]KAF1844476.1 alpha/beta-hydrolase [Cucurbitaria berberidis CBS 394.84]
MFTSILSLGSGLRAHLLRLFSLTASNPISTPTTLRGEAKCRFRLDTDSSDTFTLLDGRKLGYAQYGSLTGRPILYLHGLPGSRLEAATYHDLGLELGARIVATDRPGIGWSSPHPGQTLLDLPKDLEELAKHLALSDYAIMGVSGGGPHALACAASMSEQLKCVSIICGLGPPDIGMSGAGWESWLGFTIGWRYSPAILLRWFFNRHLLAGRLDLTDERRLKILQSPSTLSTITNEKDRELFKDEDLMRLWLRSNRESQAQGFDGVYKDGRLMCSIWNFGIEDIRPNLPVRLWYGKHDTSVPPNHGVQIAARLGGGERVHLRVEDDTHASISIYRKREQLEEILRIVERSS